MANNLPKEKQVTAVSMLCESSSIRTMPWRRVSKIVNGACWTFSNSVANNREHLERIPVVVEHLHECKAVHSVTISVHETFQGQTVRRGAVEAFDLSGHPKASKAYGRSEGTEKKERLFPALEVQPIKSATDAVRASILADAKGNK